MIFLLDENFPRTAADLIHELGHEVLDVRGSNREGCADTVLFDYAQEAGAILLTTDRDFFHTIPYLYTSHFGVVVIALRQPKRETILGRLRWLLTKEEFFPLDSKVVQLRDQTYIVREPGGREPYA